MHGKRSEATPLLRPGPARSRADSFRRLGSGNIMFHKQGSLNGAARRAKQFPPLPALRLQR